MPILRPPDRRQTDNMSLFFIVLGVICGSLLYHRAGLPGLWQGLQKGLILLTSVTPIVLMALLLAGYAQVLLPRHWVESHLGRGHGWRAIGLASLAGALMPGGPFAAFPIVLSLRQSGAALASCVGFLTAWSVLGIHRMIVWEIPWLGWRFALLRWLVSLPLPWLAATWISRLDHDRGGHRFPPST